MMARDTAKLKKKGERTKKIRVVRSFFVIVSMCLFLKSALIPPRPFPFPCLPVVRQNYQGCCRREEGESGGTSLGTTTNKTA